MIVCAGESENFDFATPIGIGLTDVAINLTQLCTKHSLDSLLFVGTAGSYGKHTIFDILTSSHATNIEIGFLDNYSYTPIKNSAESKFVSRETNSNVVVNSSNYITTNEAQGKKFLSEGLMLENMEFYAVIKVANAFNIPAFGLFCVTNYCHKLAHEEFVKNHSIAQEKLSLYVKKYYSGYANL